jgi:hypothetical protein
MLDENKIKRLAFIRYLYDLAVEQSRQPHPMSASAVLTFHDSAELFLQLARDHLGAAEGKKQPNFTDYWDILKPKLPEGYPTQGPSMDILNRARVGLKHGGVLPARESLEAIRQAVMRFFEENTQQIFGIDFSSITLIDYVQDDAARRELSEAEELFGQGRRAEALGKLALAFARIAEGYKAATGIKVRSQLPRIRTRRASYEMGGVGNRVQDPVARKLLGELLEQVQAINEAFPALGEAANVAALGLDHRRYGAFKRLTPEVSRKGKGVYEVGPHWDRAKDEDVTEEHYHFCLDFVVETAIRLQEEQPAAPAIARYRRPGVRSAVTLGLSEEGLRRRREEKARDEGGLG